MRSQGASRSENHDGKQQDMTTHEQNAKSDRQTRPEPAHNSHKSKTNDTPRPPRVRPRGQERERKKEVVHLVLCSSVQFFNRQGTLRLPGQAQFQLSLSASWVFPFTAFMNPYFNQKDTASPISFFSWNSSSFPKVSKF